MEKSIKKAMLSVNSELQAGCINMKEATQRLQGIMTLAEELTVGQPIRESVNKFALDFAKSIISLNE